ncbi:MAG: hypothetical protein DMG41_26640 [Acidobacteria bacterium]|nr:MAG: hypothetical protein AUH13_08580 [Acidobacteria bacterium 13_2_20CM_58_27]PYT75774.1 MAG: hypothetical protein DMG42_07325 [Acidobacteriota bacterium]PYT84688.1 MAG: hypothetical protein DMG41_26640 [Acidobacteriota bacterium]
METSFTLSHFLLGTRKKGATSGKAGFQIGLLLEFRSKLRRENDSIGGLVGQIPGKARPPVY